MNIIKSIFGAIKTGTKDKRALVEPIDMVNVWNKWSTYPSKGLTPVKLAEIFSNADQGDMVDQAWLYDEMLAKDDHLFAAYQMRKLAVRGKDYQVIAASEEPRDIELATFASEIIERTRNWREFIDEVLNAVPKAYSVQQIMWQIEDGRAVIDRFEILHQSNIRFGTIDPKSDMNIPRRLTDQDMMNGIELEPNKWVVAVIKALSGHPGMSALLRTNAWMYLFKNFDIKSWVQFAEIYMLPMRVGHYSTGAGDEEKSALRRALRQLGQDASAIIPDSTKIEFIEAAQKAASSSISKELAEFCNMENSKAVLGHTGAMDSTPGRLGGEDGATQVRYDLLEADALALDGIVTEQVIRRVIDLNFGPQKKYPYYKTAVQPPVNMTAIIEKYDGAVNRLRIPVVRADVYAEMGLRQPGPDDEVILPGTQAPPPFGFTAKEPMIISGSGKKKSGNFSDADYHAKIEQINTTAIDQSRKIFEPSLEHIRNIIESSESYEEAIQSMENYLISPDLIKELGTHLYETIHTADALGRSQIVNKDLHLSGNSKMMPGRMKIDGYIVTAMGLNWFAAADGPVRISFDLAPSKAVKAMKEKSFWISGLENKELLKSIQGKLERALQDGTGFKDFQQSVQATIDSMGYSGQNPYRLGTVFTTNLFSAYSLGQAAQVEGMRDRFPMWRYVAIMDERTRETHRELNGKIFRVGEGPMPPIDYNCRCTAQYLHVSETQGLQPIEEAPLRRIMENADTIKIDTWGDYGMWLKKQKADLPGEIKKIVERELS